MSHPLDNPVWNALLSENKHLATATASVGFFDKEVSPFAAIIENSWDNLQELYSRYPFHLPLFLWSSEPLPLSKEWKVLHCIPGFQMVYEEATVKEFEPGGIVKLTNTDVPEMMVLTSLTKPGPFGTRTIEFGNYEGIFEDGHLVAMTGRRFHCFDHIEISAVCTHPGYLSRGYAKQLLLSQLAQILASSCKPYLHVKADNARAIKVYESLGFSTRIPVFFYVLAKSFPG